MWSASQVLKPSRPCSTRRYCDHVEPDVEAGRRELAELEDAGPVVVRHADDVADDGHGQLRAVRVDDVDGAADRSVAQPVDQGRLRPVAPRSRSAATALVVNTDDTVLR